uniref:DUF1618 domain-containing protein n=1 Tax=Setaria viridis TaxID=4556 RepID=A0A4V6DDH8_SETVI|nr:hypothetical protein SEVIR_3G383900v2 [Setaria viridis]
MDVNDDALGLILERVDSGRWRRAVADAAFLRRYRTLHAPPAGNYHNERSSLRTSHGRPVFVPSSASMVDARHVSLDFLPDVAGSWIIVDSRGSLLLLCHADLVPFPVKFRDMVVCEPLTRRYRRIHPPPDFGCFFLKNYLLDGEANEAGGRISMSNFRVLCMFQHDDVMQGALYTVGSSWSKKKIDHIEPSFKIIYLVGRAGGLLLRIFTVVDDTMKVFIRLEGGKWVLENRVLLSEATRGLPGYKPSFFSGCPRYVLTIGTEFVILKAMEAWTFSINLETMEVAPAVEYMGLLVYGCELPWPPTLHACLDMYR